ncbi:hypothetical protein ACMFMG_002128 [Clarireedia jacksonii]
MFMKGCNVPTNFNHNNASRDIISFNSVVRGSGHPGVEKLLDWLEFGVAAAVKDKCLAKLQLSLYHKEVAPEHLLEAFTMSFTYNENTTGIHIATSTSSRPSNKIELGQAQEGLRDLIVQVMNNTQHIGCRSTGHKVSMQLVYNQNEPPKSEYRGFCAGGTSLLIPDKSGSLIGNLDTGIHKLSMAYYNAQRSASYIRDIDDATSELGRYLPSMGHTRASSMATTSEGTQQTTIQWLNRISRRRDSGCMDTQSVRESGPLVPGSGAPASSNDLEDGEIVCECRNNADEENLIQCMNCRDFSHSQCYGYRVGGKEPSITNFLCYNCICEEDIPNIAQQIYPIVIRRRAIYYLEKYGFDFVGLSDYMDLMMEQTMELVDSLVSEGIIMKDSKSSQVEFCFVDIEKMRLEYFDPTKHITPSQLIASTAPYEERISSSQTLASENQEPLESTPRIQRFSQPHNMLQSTQSFDDDRTMTPSSQRSSSMGLSGTRKRLGNDVPPNASKKRCCRELLATSPFSVRSTYP